MLRYLNRNTANVGLGDRCNTVVSVELDRPWCARAHRVAASTSDCSCAATGWRVAVAFVREVGEWGVRPIETVARPCADHVLPCGLVGGERSRNWGRYVLEVACHNSLRHNSLCVRDGRNFDLFGGDAVLNLLSTDLLVARASDGPSTAAASLTDTGAIGCPVIREWLGCTIVIIIAPTRIELGTGLASCDTNW